MMSQALSNVSNEWSNELKAHTYQSIDNCYCALDGNLHLKNKNNRFGYIHWTDLIQLKILVRIKNENPSTAKFNDVSALIDAGWVVD